MSMGKIQFEKNIRVRYTARTVRHWDNENIIDFLNFLSAEKRYFPWSDFVRFFM